jgi:2-desacetyl-2-hydroxyethyl bacteriochlorophyllide A dehydrogenase
MPRGRSVVFPEPERVQIEERDVDPPDATEVLVETKRTLVSTGTELTILSGEFPPGSNWDDYEYPFRPGYNNVGRVIETGAEVSGLDVGDRVATYGPHQEYVTADADHCRPIPGDVSDDEAAFFTIAEIVMNGIRRGRLDWGESATVYGLGLLGQLTVRLSSVAGARPVVGIDLANARLEHLPDTLGVHGVNATEEDPESAVKELSTDGALADVVFELTGNPDAITGEFDVLRDQGRFVVLSSPRGPTTFDFHQQCNAPSYEIIGAHNRSHPDRATPRQPWTQHRHCALFFQYLAEGSLAVDSLVSHRIDCRDAPELYEVLLKDRTDAMGVLLEW